MGLWNLYAFSVQPFSHLLHCLSFFSCSLSTQKNQLLKLENAANWWCTECKNLTEVQFMGWVKLWHEVQENTFSLWMNDSQGWKNQGQELYELRILHPLVTGFFMLAILFNYWLSQEHDSWQTERNTSSSVELDHGSFALSIVSHMHQKHTIIGSSYLIAKCSFVICRMHNNARDMYLVFFYKVLVFMCIY